MRSAGIFKKPAAHPCKESLRSLHPPTPLRPTHSVFFRQLEFLSFVGRLLGLSEKKNRSEMIKICLLIACLFLSRLFKFICTVHQNASL